MRKARVVLSMVLSMVSSLSLPALSLLAPSSALAAYKCREAGLTAYGDAPCPNGERLLIDTVAGNPDAAQAAHRSEQEKRQLKQFENERRKREAQEEKERQRDAHVQAARRKRCSLLAHRKTWAEEDAASATGRAADRARQKARRIAQQYDEECGHQPGIIGSSG